MVLGLWSSVYRVFTLLYLVALTLVSIHPIAKGTDHDLSREIFNNFLHVPAYGLLTFLLIKSMPKLRYSYAVSFIFALTFGIFIEYLQSFVPGRCASVSDVLLNGTGSLSVILYFSKRSAVSGLRSMV